MAILKMLQVVEASVVEPAAAAPAANQSGAPAFCTQCGVLIPAMSPGPWGPWGPEMVQDGTQKRGVSWEFHGIS